MDSVPSKVMEHDARLVSVEHRVKNLEGEMHDLRELTQAVAVTNTNVAQLSTRVDEMHLDVQRLLLQPGRRWETVVTALLTGLAGALSGALAALLLV